METEGYPVTFSKELNEKEFQHFEQDNAPSTQNKNLSIPTESSR
jgi:hypothetical protein